MIKVYIEEKSTDFNNVPFTEGLVDCGRVVEDLAGFCVFRAVDDYIVFYRLSHITLLTNITHFVCVFVSYLFFRMKLYNILTQNPSPPLGQLCFQ